MGNKSIQKYNLPAHRAQAHFDPQVQEIFDGTLYHEILQSKSEQYITSGNNTNDSSIVHLMLQTHFSKCFKFIRSMD